MHSTSFNLAKNCIFGGSSWIFNTKWTLKPSRRDFSPQSPNAPKASDLPRRGTHTAKLHYYFESPPLGGMGWVAIADFVGEVRKRPSCCYICRYIIYMQLYNYTNHILIYIYIYIAIYIYIYTHILDVTIHRYIKWHLNGNIHLYIIYTHPSIN